MVVVVIGIGVSVVVVIDDVLFQFILNYLFAFAVAADENVR